MAYFKAPFFHIQGSVIIVTLFATLYIGAFIGWVMNFQNLWEYWPITNKIGDLGKEWIISLIGIFVPPLGAFTGWIW